ncbi:hypothetical protein ACRAWD_03110 [Caulobacter segnis]
MGDRLGEGGRRRRSGPVGVLHTVVPGQTARRRGADGDPPAAAAARALTVGVYSCIDTSGQRPPPNCRRN